MREAEQRLLPAAKDTGTAVLVMRPFESGELFSRTKGQPIPEFARELGIASWAQFFLKFILGHPAVTCPIPATSDPKHLADNLGAGFGALPTDAGAPATDGRPPEALTPLSPGAPRCPRTAAPS